MSLREYQKLIRQAYKNRNRDVVEATGYLQCEAAELAELFLKGRWYNKKFTEAQILSEAGDVLNILVFILHSNKLTLTDAMVNNISKLKKRKWL